MADIFDRMLDGINKGVNSVATGSKTMIEKAKINSAINNLENEKRQLAEVLGVNAYNLYKEGKLQNLEELGSFCEQIDQKIEAIVAQRQELAKFEQPAPVQTYAANPSGGTIFCSQCGAQNDAAAKFCAKCGNNLR